MSQEQIQKKDLGKWFKSSFYAYGMSVIEERALPDVRDGLKPVHRAIIYEVLKSGITSGAKTTKVARISGNVIGNWHPHGDKAVEDALVGLSEPWSNTLPILQIKGNLGSIFGDGAAAGRYIEAKLTPAGDAYGRKLKKGIVPYIPNFDETGEMPEILPAELPYLLINGIKDGIAVGVAASLPPHNAKEALSLTLAYLKNPKAKTSELLEYMPGPDFPSGATIINKDELLSLYKTGMGKIQMRAELVYDKKEHALHVTEIPYLFAGSMDNLVAELVSATTETVIAGKKKQPPKVPGVTKVSNYSGKKGIDICIELQRGVDPEAMKQTLFAKTRLETSVKFIFNALNDKTLHTYSLRQYLAEYAQFQHEIVANEHKLEQKDLEDRLEIIMGRIIAASYIDEIVDMVRQANGKAQVKEVLMTGTILPGTNPAYHKTVKTFAFTEAQAEAIAGTPLYQLNRLDAERLKEEGKKIQARLNTVKKVIESHAYRHKLIIKRLEEELKKLPDSPRKTRIIQDNASKAEELERPTVPMFVAMDKYGYIQIEGKPFEDSKETDNKSRVGFFDRSGNCWNLFLERAKETTGRGSLSTRLLPHEEPLIGFTTAIEKEGREGLFLFENGCVKRVSMSRYFTKTKATKVNTRILDQPIKAFYDIPEGINTVEIDGQNIPLSKIPLQTLNGTGKPMLEPKEEPYQVAFLVTEQKEPEQSGTEQGLDGVVSFTEDGKLRFDWDTLDTSAVSGLYVTTYQELLTQTLLFVHADGTAKRVSGEAFTVKTKRTQIVADKEGLKIIWIGPASEETIVGTYKEGVEKRVKVSDISMQGKLGGGIRVFATTKYTFESVRSGEGSDLPIVSFATLPK